MVKLAHISIQKREFVLHVCADCWHTIPIAQFLLCPYTTARNAIDCIKIWNGESIEFHAHARQSHIVFECIQSVVFCVKKYPFVLCDENNRVEWEAIRERKKRSNAIVAATQTRSHLNLAGVKRRQWSRTPQSNGIVFEREKRRMFCLHNFSPIFFEAAVAATIEIIYWYRFAVIRQHKQRNIPFSIVDTAAIS